MTGKYTHEQAVEAAARFASLYNVYTNVLDTDFEEGSLIANYSFFGIRFEQYGPCIHTIDSEEKIANMRKLAYIIVQTDQDLSQEEQVIENIKDTPGGVRELTDHDESIDLLDFMARSLGEK